MVELAAGFSVARVESLYHGITVATEEGEVKLIRFDGNVKADRDFVLEWEAAEQTQPQAALFSENRGDATYLLMMLNPPTLDLSKQAPPEGTCFCAGHIRFHGWNIDCSGAGSVDPRYFTP